MHTYYPELVCSTLPDQAFVRLVNCKGYWTSFWDKWTTKC